METLLKKWTDTIHYFEKKTATNITKLAGQWSWLMLGRIAGAVVALLLASAYAHYLTQEQYGTYKYILAVFGILAIFTLQGMQDASQRAIARRRDAAFWETFKIRNKFGILTAVSSLGFGIYYLFQSNFTLGIIFCVSAPFLVFLNTSSHYNSILMGRQLFKHISINNTLIQVSTSLVIIGTVFLTSNIYWIVTAFIFSGIFFSLLGFIHAIKNHPLNDTLDPEAMSYGKHMSILGIVNIAANQATPLLLWHFLGPIELAIYAFAMAAVSQISGVFKLLTTTMAFPKLAKLDIKILKGSLPKKVLIAHCITIPVAILLALIIPYLYHLLFPTYLESIIYAQAMIVLLGFSPMRLYSTAIMTHGSPKAIHTYSIISSATHLISMMLLIPLFGIWGVIYANILTQIITNIVIIYLFRRM